MSQQSSSSSQDTIANTDRASSLLAHFLKGPWPYILPGVLLYASFALFPILFQFYVALTDMTAVTIYDAKFIGLENFHTVLADPTLGDVISFTIILTLINAPIQFAIGLGLALLMDQDIPGRVFFRTAIIMPIAISSVVLGIMWRLILHPSEVGIVNAWLTQIGIDPIAWRTDVTAARASIIIMNIWASTGHTFIFMLAGLQTIPKEIIEAATVDGANFWQRLIRIKLPMMRKIAGLALLFIFIGTFQLFEKALVLTEGGPGRTTTTIGLRVYQIAFGDFGGGQLGVAAALGLVLFFIILVFALIYMWFILFDDESKENSSG